MKHFKRLVNRECEKKQGLMDYDVTDVDDIVDIHKYLMKKNNSVNENI